MELDARPLIFLHIPKACGTTLIKLLTRWFDRDAIYMIGTRAREEVMNDLSAKTRDKHSAIRLIVGHAAFGLHEAFGEPGASYITVLRDPVERLLSHFYYARRNPRHPLHPALASGALGIIELAERRANLQTRYLGGALETTPDETTLAAAKENIRNHFVVAGVAERFDETVILLHRVFGRRLFPFASENVSVNREAIASLDASMLRALRDLHALDYALYDFVRERFDEQVAGQDAQQFASSLGRLRAWNRAAAWGTAAWRGITDRTQLAR